MSRLKPALFRQWTLRAAVLVTVRVHLGWPANEASSCVGVGWLRLTELWRLPGA